MPAPVHSRPLYLFALRVFRRLPAPLRRTAVRLGTPGFTVGAVCLLERDGRVLMLRQPHRDGWSLPGGLLSRGENAAAAVVREVREETGLRIEVGRPITVVVDSPLRRVDVVFHVEVQGEVGEKVGGEATTARWLVPAEIDEMDAPTRQILAAARDVAHPSGYAGRVLT
ncbi:MAG TPA: NUDIX domain-containing protein [Actinomycetales bacterium]|nr:NUDIX domain-containing protein [Actinomycetales bacterium]